MKRSNLKSLSNLALILVCAAELFGKALVIIAIKRIVASGIYADEHHTSGEMAPQDLALLFGGVFSIVTSGAAFYLLEKRLARWSSASFFTLLSLGIAMLTLFLYPFIAGVCLAVVSAILLTVREASKHSGRTWAYVCMNLIALIASFIQVLLIFTVK